MKMKKGLLTMLALLSMGSSAFAQEEVQVGTVNVPAVTRRDASKNGAQVILFEKEKEGVVLVKLENSNNMNRDLQFDLTLPEGIILKDGETGGTSPLTSHVMGFGPTTSRFVLYSKDANFLPNETLIKIPVEVAKSVTDIKTLEGQTGTLSNILTSNDRAESKLISASTTFPFRVMLLGDVDDNGAVELNDAIYIARFTVEGNPQPFVEDVADYDGQDGIALNDAIEVARSTVTDDESASSKQMLDVEDSFVNEMDPE